jgi:hypothetical protein
MLGMLRGPQHERKIINDIKASPFVLSLSKDSERFFNNVLDFKLPVVERR